MAVTEVKSTEERLTTGTPGRARGALKTAGAKKRAVAAVRRVEANIMKMLVASKEWKWLSVEVVGGRRKDEKCKTSDVE